ncbi:hypothetical protein H1C71_011205, partial [Ictidomys tridecemlineatus]
HKHNSLCLKKKNEIQKFVTSSPPSPRKVNDFQLLFLPKSSQNFRQIKAGAFDLLPRCFDHRRATYVHTFLDIFRFFTGSKALTAFSLCALWPLLRGTLPRQPRQRLMEEGLARGR